MHSASTAVAKSMSPPWLRRPPAYEQRKLVAALKVAQEDLAAEKAKSSQDQLSGYFQLAHDEKGGLQLSSRVPSLCRDNMSASVMHVTVSSRPCPTCDLTPLHSSLQAVCPRFDENISDVAGSASAVAITSVAADECWQMSSCKML